MICVVYGTQGELIKLAPVLTRLRDRGSRYFSATTGQHVVEIPKQLDQLGLPQPDLWLARGARGRDLERNADVPRWLLDVWAGIARERSRLRGASLVLVHSDTMTTVIGAVMARLLRRPVAHVEAGVRSHDAFHPFPEELNRRLVSRLAQVHYAPGRAAVANLRRGAVIDTRTNTICDSVLLCPPVEVPLELDEPYGVVSLRRFELLRRRELTGETLRALAAHAERSTPLVFVDHPVTVAAIESFGLGPVFGPRFRRVPRLGFFEFIELVRRSAFVVTDSGGTQVESWLLDVPCLVHRKLVEQSEGVGENVVVSGFSLRVLEEFLADPGRHRRRSPLPDASPADVIVADLAARGVL